jgi:hypothetical protein
MGEQDAGRQLQLREGAQDILSWHAVVRLHRDGSESVHSSRGGCEFGAAQVGEGTLQLAGADEAVEQRVAIVTREGRAEAGEQLLPELLGAQAFASFAEDEQVPGRPVVGGAESFERGAHKIFNALERDEVGADAQLWIDGEENIFFAEPF